jgi:hypothetical protein
MPNQFGFVLPETMAMLAPSALLSLRGEYMAGIIFAGVIFVATVYYLFGTLAKNEELKREIKEKSHTIDEASRLIKRTYDEAHRLCEPVNKRASDALDQYDTVMLEKIRILESLRDGDNSIAVITSNHFSTVQRTVFKTEEYLANVIGQLERTRKQAAILKRRLDAVSDHFLRHLETMKRISTSEIGKKSPHALEYADHATDIYEKVAEALEMKKRPAYQKASNFRQLKSKYRDEIAIRRNLEYELHNLYSLFPDLQPFAVGVGQAHNSDAWNDFRATANTKSFAALSEIQKSQRALDYYRFRRKKTKWEIGRDYEMSVGYELQQKGYDITYYGIEKTLEDMGRDLIATNDNEVLVVQCKYWSETKLIHEKHIAQLFGTAIMYRLQNRGDLREVKPLFVTKTSLSETAMKFAEALTVDIWANHQMTEYPMIKCKVGRSESGESTRIFHMPLDQQYDRTIIDTKNGDQRAFTVQEAYDAGFRHAYRWRAPSQS